MRDAAHLTLRGVALSLGGRPVLEGIDLTARRGETLVLLGPSGCGKTSLLRLVAGLLAPDAGEVQVNGAPPVPGRAAAMVFQSYRLLPWKSVRANVAFALPRLDPAEREPTHPLRQGTGRAEHLGDVFRHGPRHRRHFVRQIDLGVVDRVAERQHRLGVALDHDVAREEQRVAVHRPVHHADQRGQRSGDAGVVPDPDRPVRPALDRLQPRHRRVGAQQEAERQVGRLDQERLGRLIAQPREQRGMTIGEAADEAAQRQIERQRRQAADHPIDQLGKAGKRGL